MYENIVLISIRSSNTHCMFKIKLKGSRKHVNLALHKMRRRIVRLFMNSYRKLSRCLISNHFLRFYLYLMQKHNALFCYILVQSFSVICVYNSCCYSLVLSAQGGGEVLKVLSTHLFV